MSGDTDVRDFLLADAKRLGMTPAEYERAFGVIIDNDLPAARDIRRHEVHGGLMTDDDFALAVHGERRRIGVRSRRRRRSRAVRAK